MQISFYLLFFFFSRVDNFYESIEFVVENGLVGDAYGKKVWTDLEEWA